MAVTPRERIAIDMDEVIADFLSKHLALYNAEFGESLTPTTCAARSCASWSSRNEEPGWRLSLRRTTSSATWGSSTVASR